ncbi:MAG: lipocalin-like domain-containing protein [Armatimonadota bacterium]
MGERAKSRALWGARAAAAALTLGFAAAALRVSAQHGPTAPAAAATSEKPAPSKYRLALPPYQFQFPRDHAAHPEYQTEWWYYTGHLRQGDRKLGYELTFFQVGIDPARRSSRSAWALHTLYFAHFALTDENGKRFHLAETIGRPALGMAGAATDRYHVWIDDWSARLVSDDTHHLRASGDGYSIDLRLTERKPPVVHGFNGVSQKAAGAGRASHYYSMTRLETSGTLTLGEERIPVTGVSWMDHEFGSNQLTEEQLGWDWFSLQLDNNRELMLYVLRRKDGSLEPYSSGTMVHADGTWKHLPLQAYRIDATGQWKSPRTGAVYPAGWRVEVPGEKLSLTVTPTVADQEVMTEGTAGVVYWEGSVEVAGQDQGRPVTGVGYVELTGYTGPVPGI